MGSVGAFSLDQVRCRHVERPCMTLCFCRLTHQCSLWSSPDWLVLRRWQRFTTRILTLEFLCVVALATRVSACPFNLLLSSGMILS